MKKQLLSLILLCVFGHSFAQQTNHWTTIVGTQYNLTMSGVISIDNEAQASASLEIAAFCGTECRGSVRAQLFPPTGEYVVCLTVVSNQQSGEAITFRLYDHDSQQEFPSECINSITFNANDNLGTMGDWYPFAFVSSHTQDVTLSAGWNWWAPTVEATLQDLETVLGANGLTIVSENSGTLSYADGQWSGTLESLVLGQMYRINTSSPCEFTLTGAKPASVEVSLAHGAHWFGFTGSAPTAVGTAFGTAFGPVAGDKVVSQNGGFAIYNGTAWQGTLATLLPGQGYVYVSQSNETKTLVME